jgi:hypothetical protein
MLMKVVDRVEHLADCLCSVLLGELALLANAVEQLSSSRQLGHDVVLVLAVVSLGLTPRNPDVRTLDSNQSWNLTMCGCFIFCSISSSS